MDEYAGQVVPITEWTDHVVKSCGCKVMKSNTYTSEDSELGTVVNTWYAWYPCSEHTGLDIGSK